MDFELAVKAVLESTKEQRNINNGYGIGTLSEKTVHAILKRYYEPNEDYHEVPINGMVADIYRNGKIIEIQTRSFNKMRNKLDKFLPEYKVTIVYPIAYIKNLIWIDEDTGNLSKKRKSPRKGDYYDAFYELYKIKMYLDNPNLSFRFVLLNIDEYRLLNGWSKDKKKGSQRYDRIPTELVGEMSIDRIEDYVQLLPIELPDEFTVSNYKDVAHISEDSARIGLHILNHIGVIEKIGKQGRKNLYRIK